MVKLVYFSSLDSEIKRIGLYYNNRIVDLSKAFRVLYNAEPPNLFLDMKQLIENNENSLKLIKNIIREIKDEDISKFSYEPTSIIYHPPIPNPEKIFCLAVNYKAHGQEAGTKPPDEPYVFTKFANALVGHNNPVIIPKSSKKVDYEIELAVIIGKRGKYIKSSEAMNYVFGYTIFNDVSFRDRQFPPGWPKSNDHFGQRWVHGKGMDTAAPIGPWIVTKDEIEDPYSLKMIMRVNGEVRQEGHTKDMIFKIDKIIEYISDGITLRAGDIISTGTPAGVGFTTGRYLRAGDIMEAEISKIGVLRNYLIEEK